MSKLPQSIILAAGHSSRMFPYSGPHKSMIEIGGRPILWYVIQEIKKSGGTDIVIVISPDNTDIPAYFKNGKAMGISIKYAVQKKPKGMGDALLSAKNYIQDKFFIVNPNHINLSGFLPSLAKSCTFKYEGVLLGNKTKTPARYGVFKLKGDKILEIVEKPKQGREPSNIRVVGLYLLNRNFLQTLTNTPQSKYQLEVALNKFFKKNNVRLLLATKESLSLKYPWDLFRIKDFLASKIKRRVSSKAIISSRAIFQGAVVVEEGAQIFEEAILKGPVYVGRNAVVGNHTLIRDNTFLEEGARIGAMTEIRNSLFMKDSSLHSGFVGDSIVGENTRIGAGFVTANRRFDRGEIFAYVDGKKTPTCRTSLGAIIGHNVSIGIKSGTMPGVIVGSNSIVYPGTIVYKNIQEKTVVKRLS